LLIVERSDLLRQQQSVVAANDRHGRAQLVADNGEQLLAVVALSSQALPQPGYFAIRTVDLPAQAQQFPLEGAEVGYVFDHPCGGTVSGRDPFRKSAGDGANRTVAAFEFTLDYSARRRTGQPVAGVREEIAERQLREIR